MLSVFDQPSLASRDLTAANFPIFICLLGEFRLLKAGNPIAMRHGSKAENLLCNLALEYRVARERLCLALWPHSEKTLAHQSLNSLVHSLHNLLGDAIGGLAPVLHIDGWYRLNVEAGVSVDVALFDALVNAGNQHSRAGDTATAVDHYTRAIKLYHGNLSTGTEDVRSIIESERLRTHYLTILSYLADYVYSQQDYVQCLEYVSRLLANDPCREDAHRLAMRCYMRQGNRGQALRQYRVCQNILQAEFGAQPESTTQSLFNQIRENPGSLQT